MGSITSPAAPQLCLVLLPQTTDGWSSLRRTTRPSKISRRFGSIYHLVQSQSKISLRGLMWKHARAGNAAITLRLDDRSIGPVERKPQVDDDFMLLGTPESLSTPCA